MSRKKSKSDEVSTLTSDDLVINSKAKFFAKKDLSQPIAYIQKELVNHTTPDKTPIWANVAQLMEKFNLRIGWKCRVRDNIPIPCAKINRTLRRRLEREYDIFVEYAFNEKDNQEYARFYTEK